MRSTLLCAPLSVLLACTGLPTPAYSNPDSSVDTAPDWSDCTTMVEPGADPGTAAQTALIVAAEGDTVCLAAGTWTLTSELSLTTNNVTIKGAGIGQTILDFSTQTVGAQGMSTLADGTTFKDFTVMDPPGDGIRATDVQNVTWSGVEVGWSAAPSTTDGAYGIYPVGCDMVRVEDSVIHGASDAGVYVGQSTHILVKGNEVYDNVTGIEIENSTDAEVTENHAHDNTAGILVFNLPGLEVGDGKRTLVTGNTSEMNNTPNFGSPGSIVSNVPQGIGVVVLASDSNEVTGNNLNDNGSAGVFILSYIEAFLGSYDDPNYNAYAAGNYVHENRFLNNGTAPDPLLASLLASPRPLPDIIWDGCEDPVLTAAFNGNCVYNNGVATYLDADFCGGFANPNTDISAVTCVGQSVAEQNL